MNCCRETVKMDKDGTPFWTMSPEELARERAGK